MKKVFLLIQSEKGKYLSSLFGVLGVLLPALIIAIGEALFSYDIRIQSIFANIAILIMFSLLGCLGTTYILRKEVAPLVRIQGGKAQIYGLSLLLISIFFVCFLIIKLISLI